MVATLGDLYRSRGLLLGMLSTMVGLLLMIVAPDQGITVSPGPGGRLLIGEPPDSFLSRLHLADVGAAVFQVGLTLTLFQVLLNQIAEDRFVEQVRGALDEQQDQVQLAVARSLAAADHLEDLKLAPRELDRVIESASRLRSGSPELGAVIARKLRTGVFESDEIWRNLVVRAELLELLSAANTGKQFDYYSVYFQFGYYTTNVRRTRFAFRVGRWQDEYDKILRSEDLGAAWRLPSTGEFDDDWASGFQLINASFGGRNVNTIVNEVEREYIAYVPSEQFEDSESIFVQYSFTAVVLADGNLLSFEVPKPTFGATYSVSISVRDIERIRALDYFGATRPASIDYAPSLAAPRVVSVSIDDWILPKAGVVIIWKRRSDPGVA